MRLFRRGSGPIDHVPTESAPVVPGSSRPPDIDTDLPADRHRVLREHLMSEIRLHHPHPEPRRRLVLLAPVTAAAAVVVAAAGIGLATHWPSAPAHRPGIQAGAPHAASPTPSATARDPRIAYARTAEVQYVSYDGASGQLTTSGKHTRIRYEVWDSADGTVPARHTQAIDGRPESLHNVPGYNRWGGDLVPSYTFLAALPTQPAKLAAVIRANDPEHDQAVNDIQAMLRAPMLPAGLATALFTVAPRYSGVTRLADATDGAGRHGVALAVRSDDVFEDGTVQKQQREYVFDARWRFLGTRTVQLNAAAGLPAGTVVDVESVVARGWVGSVGRYPAR